MHRCFRPTDIWRDRQTDDKERLVTDNLTGKLQLNLTLTCNGVNFWPASNIIWVQTVTFISFYLFLLVRIDFIV